MKCYPHVKRIELGNTWGKFKFVSLNKRSQNLKPTLDIIIVIRQYGKGKTIEPLKSSVASKG